MEWITCFNQTGRAQLEAKKKKMKIKALISRNKSDRLLLLVSCSASQPICYQAVVLEGVGVGELHMDNNDDITNDDNN